MEDRTQATGTAQLSPGSLRRLLSEPRFQPYLRETRGDTTSAFVLYRWNMALSAASYEALHLVEVGMRNAMNAELCTWNAAYVDRDGAAHGSDWLFDPHLSLSHLLGGDRQVAIDRARQAVRRAGRPPSTLCHDDVVAQVTLGTWRFLLPAKTLRKSPFKRDLWEQGLHQAFPHLTRDARNHAALVDDVDRIHRFRNRVAHLEPIIQPGLVNAAYAAMCRVTSDIDPGLRSWLDMQSRVDKVLSSNPRTPSPKP